MLSSIRERLKQLTDGQFETLLARLEEKGYDLSVIRQQGVAKVQTINDALKLVQQSAEGLEYLETLLDRLDPCAPLQPKPIPKLLPYLVDRTEQVWKLCSAIFETKSTSTARDFFIFMISLDIFMQFKPID